MACCTYYNRVPEAVGELRKSSSPEGACIMLPFTRHRHGDSEGPTCLNVDLQLRGAWGLLSVFVRKRVQTQGSRSPEKISTVKLMQKCD